MKTQPARQSSRQSSLKRHFDKVDVTADGPKAKRQINTSNPNPKPEETSSNEQDLPTSPTAMDTGVSGCEDEDDDDSLPVISSPAPITPGMTVANRTNNAVTFPNLSPGTNAAPPAKKLKASLTIQEKAEKAAEKAKIAADALAEKKRAAEALAGPAAKKARKDQVSAEEKAAKAAAQAQELAEKAAEKEKKLAEKAQKEQQAAADKEKKLAEKALKDVEKAIKDAEKTAIAAEKAKKAAEKNAKVAEKLAKEEALRKSQLTLGSFFSLTATSMDGKGPKKGVHLNKLRASESPAPSSAASHPDESEYQEPEVSQYHLVFSDFFLKDETTLAPFTYFQRDQEATEITKHSMDGYLEGSKSPGRVREYDALSLFHLPNIPKRGRAYMAVAEIFAGITGTASQVVGGASQVVDLTLEDQNAKILESRDILKRTPMKILQFQEDVRPPYRGTYTRTPLNGVAALARNPFRRDLPDQNYDNDSEAEWVEDDDDAEDLNDEDDDEEDDDDEDMEDFLDDENDENAQAKRRLVLQSDIEPVSTGLCWEDKHKQNSNVKMMPFRMEVILDPKLKSIDPFSSSYWEPSPKSMPPPRLPLHAVNAPNTKAAKIASVKSFFTPTSEQSTSSDPPTSSSTSTNSKKSSGSEAPKKMIPESDMPAFRAAVQGSILSKIGLIETLKAAFPASTAGAITETLLHIAHKDGKKRGTQWVLNDPNDADT